MLENGFNRFPRASRSIRARGPIGKKCDNVPQNHSFEILASVAGKLLDKSEKFSDTDTCYFGRDQSCAFDGNARTKKVDDRDPLELRSCDCSLENAFRYNRSGTADSDGKHAFVDYRPCFSGLSERKLEEMNRDRRITDEIDILTVSSVDRKVSEDKPLESGCLFSCHTTNIQDVVHGYGDKTLLSTGDKRESNGKLALGVKDESYYTTDAKIEEVHDDKRTCHVNEKSQKIFPFKKRKFFNHDPLSLSDQGFHRKEAFNSPENRINGKFCGAGQDSSPNSEECNVKLSIKSFKVPELFIDISTNATVGSLKRSVMKAVTSILGDGLHVGILVQGKKVRDDSKTLIQTGISQDDKSHNLGFVLEPKHSRTTMSTSFKNEPLLSRAQSHELTMHLASQRRTSKDSLHPQFKKNLDGCVGTELGAVKTLADTSTTKTNLDLKSLVPVPKISMKALAVVPLHQKPGHHEYGQRRIRRPFSVSEVEALVRAVEKLGTGRWRDVKFHAFDNAKHRTYVDLKDKWKTLVHTARISPQQRRGEPVPQELLDRVLAAQAFWSHRQAKQHPMIAI